MIVNIRGTHGSGKSTIVRNVLEKYSTKEELRIHTRRRPLGYICTEPEKPQLFIPGHYETPCGGCDTILVVDDAYNLIRKYAEEQKNVLFEGILAQHSTRNLLALHADFPVVVLYIDIPDSECVEAVQARRAEKGSPPLKSTDNIIKEARNSLRAAKKLKAQDISVEFHNRQGALDRTLELLGWQ